MTTGRRRILTRPRKLRRTGIATGSEWSSHVGEDEAVSATTINTIHRAFDAWQHDLLGRGLTPSTAERARG